VAPQPGQVFGRVRGTTDSDETDLASPVTERSVAVFVAKGKVLDVGGSPLEGGVVSVFRPFLSTRTDADGE